MSKKLTFILSWLLVAYFVHAEKPSLRFKLGQMLIVGFHETEFTSYSRIAKNIRNNHIGGIIFYGRNILNPSQLQQLTNDIKAFSFQQNPSNPLFIAIDHEGGVVNRLKLNSGFHNFILSHAALGIINDPSFTFHHTTQMAKELDSFGFNLNFAPVVDLKINPYNPIIAFKFRSFSIDPLVTTSHAISFIDAMHDYDILCALKHFPGHGSSSADSHLDITDVSQSWSPHELFPYKTLIQQGYSDFIMTAHVIDQLLDDSTLPDHTFQPIAILMTFSKKVLTDLLRNQLGFKGVLITDDLTMGAIAKNYSLEQALQYAINAGVDMFIFANHAIDDGLTPGTEKFLSGKNDLESTTTILNTLESLVSQGKISMERINEAYERITIAKSKLRFQE